MQVAQNSKSYRMTISGSQKAFTNSFPLGLRVRMPPGSQAFEKRKRKKKIRLKSDEKKNTKNTVSCLAFGLIIGAQTLDVDKFCFPF